MTAGSAEVSLTTRPGRECTVVLVNGTLDLATVPQLRTFLLQVVDDGASTVVLDLAEVSFIDSSGVGAIVSMYKNLHLRSGRLCLAAVRPSVLRVFQLTSIDRLVSIFPTVEAAEEEFAVAGGER